MASFVVKYASRVRGWMYRARVPTRHSRARAAVARVMRVANARVHGARAVARVRRARGRGARRAATRGGGGDVDFLEPRVSFDVGAAIDPARAREDASDADEYEIIASRVEARLALAVEALRRGRNRGVGGGAGDARAREGAGDAGASGRVEGEGGTTSWSGVGAVEERLRAATATLAATREELERERARAAALSAEVERVRTASEATVGERNDTALELAASVAELEAEKAEAIRERARLTELKYELEQKMEEVRLEAREVRSIKERMERENEITHEKMRANQLRLLESEMERKVLFDRLRSAGDETLVGDLRQDLAAERARRRELERTIAELHKALDSSNELVASYQEQVESLRRLGVGASVPLDALEPDDEAKQTFDRRTAQAIEAHLIWRRREAHREPGDAESDWRRAEAALADRLARRDGDAVAYWAHLDALAELCVLGDVSALDVSSARALGAFIARVSTARASARARADPAQ